MSELMGTRLEAAMVGAVGVLCALVLWYGWPMLHRRHPTAEPDRQDPSDIASKIASGMVQASLVPLALGMGADFYVIVAKR